MPVQFLTSEQRADYGRYAGEPHEDELTRYFHFDDTDHALIDGKRGDYNRLGFALQLTTVRFLGTFIEDPLNVPEVVIRTLARQLQITDLSDLSRYRSAHRRWKHTAEIKSRYAFRDWVDPIVGFRLSRWLYVLCWTGTDRPGILFDRATSWLLANKVILPGCTTLERYVEPVPSEAVFASRSILGVQIISSLRGIDTLILFLGDVWFRRGPILLLPMGAGHSCPWGLPLVDEMIQAASRSSRAARSARSLRARIRRLCASMTQRNS